MYRHNKIICQKNVQAQNPHPTALPYNSSMEVNIFNLRFDEKKLFFKIGRN